MSNSIPLYLSETLDSDRLDLLPTLRYFKEQWYILWGGTSLALQYGHRDSIDFDYFIDQDLDTVALFATCLDIFKSRQVQKTFESRNTLYISVDGIKISFFSYHYDPLETPLDSKYFRLYTPRDIWAMKLRAIQNRATNKDYVDLYYILQNMSLADLLDSFDQKFGQVVSRSLLLKSLIYFEDIVEEPLLLTDRSLNFDDVKDFLVEKVKVM